MLTVEEAQGRILADVPLQPVEEVPLDEALGRVLATDVASRVDVPPWDNSAMDGYAVIAADTVDAPVTLRLLEIVGAGTVSGQPVVAGTAIGVMTGAPVPAGADAVVMVEDTDGSMTDRVEIRKVATATAHIRRRGEDVASGTVVARGGDILTPARIGLVSSVGHPTVAVRQRPVVAVLSTGDEVVPAGVPLGPGQIWSSNNATLCGLVRQAGGVPLDLGIVPDALGPTVAALARAVEQAQVVVTTGGVSVGAYDFVKDALAEVGGSLDFWKVRMKPGKPLAFGRAASGVPLFGLPGNPVSCMVNFLQFVRPWIRTSLGDRAPFLPVVAARAAGDFTERPGRARLIRVRVHATEDGLTAEATGSQSSGVLTSMALADGLLLVGPEAPPPARGDRVRVQLLNPLPGGAGPEYGW